MANNRDKIKKVPNVLDRIILDEVSHLMDNYVKLLKEKKVLLKDVREKQVDLDLLLKHENYTVYAHYAKLLSQIATTLLDHEETLILSKSKVELYIYHTPVLQTMEFKALEVYKEYFPQLGAKA